jgi:hypothetical protein
MFLLLVQYATHVEAVRAIVGLSRTALGGNILKASWGRHQAGQAGAQRVHERLSGTPEPFSPEEPHDSMQQGSAPQCGTFEGYVDWPLSCVFLLPCSCGVAMC